MSIETGLNAVQERLVAFFQRTKWGWAVFGTGLVPVYALSSAGLPEFARFGVSVSSIQGAQISANLLAASGGLLAGFLLIAVILARGFKPIVLALIALTAFYFILRPGIGAGLTPVSAVLGFIVGLAIAWSLLFSGGFRPTTFGSAQWADYDHLRTNGLLGERGFWLGNFPVPKDKAKPGERSALLRYGGDRHLLTVAPTRAGKGVSTIIPNLLTYPGSALVIDPKGENALITAIARHKLGQQIFIVDPWGVVASRFRLTAARFNPLDWLRSGDPDMTENAMLLADALVVKSEGKDQFWDEEAKALLMGLILHVATDADERKNRHLGRVRDLLLLDDKDMEALFRKMYASDNSVVSSTGARSLQKDPKLLSNVLASAQAQTHFLDSARMRENLSASDFRFEDLKAKSITVYLVLPADRLNTFGRWLRLLIQQAITVNARNIADSPEHPVLFVLDEMPALGHLTMVEQAFGLMAGFGMQLWGIVQDLSQLERIYGKGWQTFISNSGVLQYFGSRDQMSAEYFSKLCGVTTLMSLSTTISNAVSHAAGGSSSSETTGTTQAEAQRSLAYPDELMTLPKGRQLLLVENMNPIAAEKITWYEHPDLAERGINLRHLQEEQRRRAAETPTELDAPPSAVLSRV
jgi:type IV secretion system protein VirD4